MLYLAVCLLLLHTLCVCVCVSSQVLGDNLLALIKSYNYEGIPIPVVRNLARQMLIALDYLHRYACVHRCLLPLTAHMGQIDMSM